MKICEDNLNLVYNFLEDKDKLRLSEVSKKCRNIFWYCGSKPRNKVFINISRIGDLIKRLNCINPPIDDLLINASTSGYTKIVKFLTKTFINNTQCYGKALYQASANNHLDVVAHLISRCNPDLINKAFIIACRKGYAEIVKFIVKTGEYAVEFERGIYYASSRDHLKVVECLINCGTNDSVISGTFANACQHGHMDIVKYIVELNDQYLIDIRGGVCCASRNGHLEVVKYLVPNFVDTDLGSAFCEANKYGHLEIIKWLFSTVVDNNHSNNFDGQRFINSVFCRTVYEGHLSIVKYFVSSHTISAICVKRALRVAIIRGHTKIACYLLNCK